MNSLLSFVLIKLPSIPTLFLSILGIYILILSLLFLYRYFIQSHDKRLDKDELTIVYCKKTPLNSQICKIMEGMGHYIPPWWYNIHLTTLFEFGKRASINYDKEVLKHADGSEFVIEWYPKMPAKEEKVKVKHICIVIPGLGTSSKDNYVTKFVKVLAEEHDIYCVIVGARGLDHPLSSTADKVWHPAFREDSCHTLHHVHEEYPSASLFLAGFSAGTNIALHTILHREKHVSRLSGAFCLNVNYHYSSSRKRLESYGYLGKMYSYLLAFQMKKIFSKNSQRIIDKYGHETYHGAHATLLLSEFDEYCGKHLYGFSSEDELCEHFSYLQKFEKVNIPLLIVQPSDDPLHMGRLHDHMPVQQLISNPQITFVETKYGSHLGYVEGDLVHSYLVENHCYRYPAKIAAKFFRLAAE